MAEITDLTDRNYVRQQSIIINAKYALSRAEIDIVLTLLTAIHKEDKDFKDYEFTLKDLELKTGRQWNSKQLKDTIKSLMSKPIELPKIKKVKKNKKVEEAKKTKKVKKVSWAYVNWFSCFEYDEGLITCRFDKALKPYLLDIQGRIIIGDIRHLLPMKSSYSKRMYLLLKEYKKFGVRKFEVEELMDILKVPQSLKTYSNFNAKVLKRAEEDINNFSDLKISFDTKKIGRKVKSIIFTIEKNSEDLKTFIDHIRENHTNVLLCIVNKAEIKCDERGLLYNAINSRDYDKDTAMDIWKNMHFNRENIFKHLFSNSS